MVLTPPASPSTTRVPGVLRGPELLLGFSIFLVGEWLWLRWAGAWLEGAGLTRGEREVPGDIRGL